MKRVLLVDAVESPAERSAHALGSVERWFGRYFKAERGVSFQVLPASSPDLASAADAADGVIISGSPRDAWSDTPDVLAMMRFAQQRASCTQPILGVCFGHQLLARALGAEVRRNPAGWEVGARTVELTPAGMNSPLFAGFDAEFVVMESHRDAVLTLPSGAELLVANAHTPIQAFGVEERLFGVQFHPEMSGDILRYVWTERRDMLRGEVSFDLDEALNSAEADASRIFQNFIAILP
jgi:GMP synthase (glutamine-hydrolysing)